MFRVYIKYFILLSSLIIFIGCSQKQKVSSSSKIVIIKTPTLKFYDTGFIIRYNDHTHLQVYQTGHIALDIKIYKDEVCQSSFKCISAKEFNRKYLSTLYEDDFLYNLFLSDNINFKDKQNKIIIKVK